MPDPSVNVTTQDARSAELTAEPEDDSGTTEIHTEADGSLIIRPPRVLDADKAVPFRQLLVRAVRKIRPNRLIVSMAHVRALDAINLGTLAALCGLADDHKIVVLLADPTAEIRSALLAAGVPTERIRYTRDTVSVDTPEVASMS
jgi:anti-anti-sigma regulatory factor